MPSLHFETELQLDPDAAWLRLGRFIRGEETIFSVIAEVHMEEDVRVGTTVSGSVVRERLVTVDHERHRLSYVVEHRGDGVELHHASMEILPHPAGCRFRWIADFLPATPPTSAKFMPGAFSDLTTWLEA